MNNKTHKVTSPVMGTFYRATAPGAPPLVAVGQRVQPTDLVCMVESMKIYTELRAEVTGVIKSILVENEAMIMKNEELIEIEIE